MKVVINGEAFDYDEAKRPLSEALAIEKAWGRRYAEWEQELMAGSAEATAVFAWTVWRRDGRDVKLEDILSGEVDFDYAEVMNSLTEAGIEKAKAAEAAQADPTSGAGPLTERDGTGTTSAVTQGRSASSSASGRGKSKS